MVSPNSLCTGLQIKRSRACSWVSTQLSNHNQNIPNQRILLFAHSDWLLEQCYSNSATIPSWRDEGREQNGLPVCYCDRKTSFTNKRGGCPISFAGTSHNCNFNFHVSLPGSSFQKNLWRLNWLTLFLEIKLSTTSSCCVYCAVVSLNTRDTLSITWCVMWLFLRRCKVCARIYEIKDFLHPPG